MPQASIDTDTAVGDLIASAASTFFNGEKVVLDGDSVASHGSGSHGSAKVVAGTTDVFAEGKKIAKKDDSATCGDKLTGSADVYIN